MINICLHISFLFIINIRLMFSLKPKNKDNNQTPNRPLSNSNMKQPPK